MVNGSFFADQLSQALADAFEPRALDQACNITCPRDEKKRGDANVLRVELTCFRLVVEFFGKP